MICLKAASFLHARGFLLVKCISCCPQRPKTPAGTLLAIARGVTEEEKAQKAKEDNDVLANSILNHQTNSIRQV